MRLSRWMVMGCLVSMGLAAQTSPMDKDLMEVSVAKLHRLYAQKKYTVTQVTEWYLARMERYDHVYHAMLLIDRAGALAKAAEEDKQPRMQRRGALWGVPIVVKANTSVKGWTTSAGWKGFLVPGKELVAPEDAMVVKHLKAAGAVLLGQTNMPDFAASDTNVSTAGGRTGDAYNWRYSPGGSSGGTAMAVAGNYAVLGTGTDTANSIRQPAANNSLVGFLPTRGVTSIAGIEPLDWLRDNTGPLARTVEDAAVALSVMQGADALDPRTKNEMLKRQTADYSAGLKAGSLKGKRFAVPYFILEGSPSVYTGDDPPDHGAVSQPTRALLMQAVEALRRAGATVLIEKDILPESFFVGLRTMNTRPYRREGVELFLKHWGGDKYRSVDEFEQLTGEKFPPFMLGGVRATDSGKPEPQMQIETDPEYAAKVLEPRAAALKTYLETLAKYRLDGFVYPVLQMPTYDETAPGASKAGPYSETGWVNRIGVPAVSLPGGFYENGLPFGIEFSGRPWRDGDLLQIAYAWEMAMHARRLPQLVESK